MEPDQEGVSRIMQHTGANEQEALALYHLARAGEYLSDIYRPRGNMTEAITIDQNLRQLRSMIAMSIIERDRPEGWAPTSDEEDHPDQG